MDIDSLAVAQALREVAAAVITPRFRALTSSDIHEKTPGDLVTIADHEAERALAIRLEALAPGVPVVGEEAVAADPRVRDAVHAPAAWLVDPLDGTLNFVEGSEDFAVMVALLQGGETTHAWIHRPTSGVTYVAERSAGAYRDGVRLARTPAPNDGPLLRGAALTRFMPADVQRRVLAGAARLGEVGGGRRCAGVEHPQIAEGEQDFAVFWRTLPWDHAPGALIVTEAGGLVARPDGAPYRPDDDGVGLVAAADAGSWVLVREALLG